MTRYLIELRTRKYVKECGFLSFGRNLCNKYGRRLLDSATKTELDALKSSTKKVPQKAAEAAGQLIESNIVNKIVKITPDEDLRNIPEIIFPQSKDKRCSMN